MAIESPDAADVVEAARVLGTTPERLVEHSGARQPALSGESGVQRLTLRTLQYDDPTDAVETGQLDVFIRGDVVVSLHRPPTHATRHTARQTVATPAVPPSQPSAAGWSTATRR
ncbi:hypothetical protein [Nocardioides daphniae]|uniref:Uncharacterized protein n=1 Tax=Nocardioides daphniae TaxID=402297 RepID=A0A4V1CWH5_9ACTN|nr:hypothetical protein [Nocardioides daphniae]QCC77287.1 hypothetical protein E2C04_08975 [Nocardioides daphniae]